MPYADKTLTCLDCGQQFVFTADDQEYYASRGFTEPKRCRSCRALRRNEREGDVGAGAAVRPPRPEREMFDVVCSNCGQQTKVPFQPRGDRPVYCRDCYDRIGRPAGGISRGAGGGGVRGR